MKFLGDGGRYRAESPQQRGMGCFCLNYVFFFPSFPLALPFSFFSFFPFFSPSPVPCRLLSPPAPFKTNWLSAIETLVCSVILSLPRTV